LLCFRLAHLIEPTKRALYGRFGRESVVAVRTAGGQTARIVLWICLGFVNFCYQKLDFLIQKGLIEP